jgi:hypothetical protein
MTFVAPFNSAFVASPVESIAAISRVRRRASAGKASRLDGEARTTALTSALRTPFDASSDATQAALSGLRLGG